MVGLMLDQRVLVLLAKQPGLTDRELTDLLLGADAGVHQVNQACRRLAAAGRIERKERPQGLTANYLGVAGLPAVPLVSRRPSRVGPAAPDAEEMQEDEVKRRVESWLSAEGWQVQVQSGGEPGIDIEAQWGAERWLIVAKGCGSRPEMRDNYFPAMLGEILQHMDDPAAWYSIALPDLPHYRDLWQRLPALARTRTQISVLFVRPDGEVEQVK